MRLQHLLLHTARKMLGHLLALDGWNRWELLLIRVPHCLGCGDCAAKLSRAGSAGGALSALWKTLLLNQWTVV